MEEGEIVNLLTPRKEQCKTFRQGGGGQQKESEKGKRKQQNHLKMKKGKFRRGKIRVQDLNPKRAQKAENEEREINLRVRGSGTRGGRKKTE